MYVDMSATFEKYLIDYVKHPHLQDEFQASVLESLLRKHDEELNVDYVEDVIQILHKCIVELEKLQVSKIQCMLQQRECLKSMSHAYFYAFILTCV